jgi:O-antigen/teichoic acid export membrane protein
MTSLKRQRPGPAKRARHAKASRRKNALHAGKRQAGWVWRKALGRQATAVPRHAVPEVSETPSDGALKKMFGRDLVYLIGSVLPLVLTAAIVPVVTRILGDREFGISQLGVTIAQVLWWLFGLGLQTGIQREYERHDGLRRAKSLLGFSCISVPLLTALGFITAPYWADLVGAPHSVMALRIATIWGGTGSITYIALGLLRSTERVRPYLFASIAQSIFAQAVGLAVVETVNRSAVGYLEGVLFGQVIAMLVVLIATRPPLFSVLKIDNLLRPAFAFSLPLVPQQLSAYVLWAGDRIIVQRDLGPAATGRYAVAYAVGSIGMTILGQLNLTWLPRVFGMKDVEERRQLLHNLFVQLTSILYPMLLGISLLAPALLLVAAPQTYGLHSLVLVVTIIVPSAIPQAFYHANIRVLLAHNRTASLALATTFCAAFNLYLNVLFVPHLGIKGSALATLVAYVLLALLTHLLVLSEPDRLSIPLGSTAVSLIVIAVCLSIGLLPWHTYTVAAQACIGVGCIGFAVRRTLRFGVLA